MNTAGWEEISERLGLSAQTAKCIVWYREKNGDFTCPEDLLNVARFGNGSLKKCRDKLEF